MITRVKGSTFNTEDNLAFVSIADYGAIGDDSTDNTFAIQQAIDTGLPIYIPPGIYLTDSLLVEINKQKLFGCGELSVLKLISESAGALINLGDGTSISDIMIDGNSNNQSSSEAHGILISNTSHNISIARIYIYNCLGDGISIDTESDRSEQIKIDGCKVIGSQQSGLRIKSGNNIIINNSMFSQAPLGVDSQNGITLNPTDTLAFIRMISITNCNVTYNLGKGIYLAGLGSKNVENVIICNNTVSGNSSHGIHAVTTQQVLCHNNIVKDNLGDGVRLEGDTIYCRVSGSVSDTNTLFSMREVIAGSIPNNNIFYYNVLRNNGTDTIAIVGANSFVV